MFLTEYNQDKVLEQERREVERMTYEKVVTFLTEYNQDKVLEQERRDSANNERRRVATDMLRKNLPLTLIEEISKLSQDTIQTLAEKLGISTSN